jgi:TorA maturation chaperone TorD
MIELIRALAVVAEGAGAEQAAVADALGVGTPTPAEHTDVFVFQLYPYASVHLGPEGQLGGVARDRVAGFLRALGQTPPAEPDHLAVLLGAYAALLDRERDAADDTAQAAWRRAREALLVEHLLSWAPAFVRRVADLGGPGHRAWAGMLDDVLACEAARTPAASTLLSAHLVHAPGLEDPRDGLAREFIDGLLAPARTGVIVTASDLARLAEDLGLGRRVGERRFVLRALLDQDAAAVLGWLADASAADSQAWQTHWLAATPTGGWWRDRSAATAELLARLADDCRAIQGDIAVARQP